MERLSSGLRINSAKDDAAGLQIADRMTTQINGLDQSVRNANDGISVAQTAEGAMQEMTTALQRMRQLAIQAENGVNGTDDKAAIKKEVDALIAEISRNAASTEFNGRNLLSGGAFTADFQVGAQKNQTITVAIDQDLSATTGLSLNSVDVVGDVPGSLDTIDAALKTVNGERADLGAVQNRFESTIRNLSNISENVSAARSRIRDADFAAETANLTRNQIIQQASTNILAQANQRPQAALSLLG
jgi:flagellin